MFSERSQPKYPHFIDGDTDPGTHVVTHPRLPGGQKTELGIEARFPSHEFESGGLLSF